jgi:serine/threonine protein kinase
MTGSLTGTRLGTEAYMSPELFAGRAYNPAQADLFAAGTIIFILYAGYPPFSKAHARDSWYNLILNNRFDTFWSCHARNKPAGFFNDSFKNLISGLIAANPEQRITLDEVIAHTWFTEDPQPATLEDA